MLVQVCICTHMVVTPLKYLRVDHWLMHPTIQELRGRIKFHIRVDESVIRLPPRVKKTSIRTTITWEVPQTGLRPTINEIVCEFERSRSDGGQLCVPIVAITAVQPTAPHGELVDCIVILDPGDVTARNPDKRSWSVVLEGRGLIGRTFSFVKTERERRKDANSPLVASLILKEDIGNAPAGSYIRVRSDCVCGFDS